MARGAGLLAPQPLLRAGEGLARMAIYSEGTPEVRRAGH